MWISKEADVRKKELLDAALELFYSKGYDKTSINDIINLVGVTKGAFYYYFKSKEEVLEAITGNLANAVVGQVEVIARDAGMSALEKLNAIYSNAEKFRKDAEQDYSRLYRILIREENTLFATRFLEYTVKGSLPLMTLVIEQGIRENSFNVSYPCETAELLIRLSSLYRGKLAAFIFSDAAEDKHKADVARREILFYNEAVERLVGLKKGSLAIAKPLLERIQP